MPEPIPDKTWAQRTKELSPELSVRTMNAIKRAFFESVQASAERDLLESEAAFLLEQSQFTDLWFTGMKGGYGAEPETQLALEVRFDIIEEGLKTFNYTEYELDGKAILGAFYEAKDNALEAMHEGLNIEGKTKP